MNQPVLNYGQKLKIKIWLWVYDQTVQPGGSVFGGYNTYLVLLTYTNSNFVKILSESKVMAKVWFRHFFKNSSCRIAVELWAITSESDKIDQKSLLATLVQTFI